MDKKRSLIWALWGALGFGAGGAVGGAVWVAFDAPQVGFGCLGLLGGTVLGLASKAGKKTMALALYSAVGFAAGFLAGFFVVLVLEAPMFQRFLIGAIGGFIGGGILGLATQRDFRRATILALVSALSYGLGFQITAQLFQGIWPQVLSGAVGLAAWGAIGGAAVGSAWGWLYSTGEPPTGQPQES